MSKLLNIAWKDLLVTFRDPTALIMMLATPFALTVAMAMAFGGLLGGGSSSGGMSKIPVAIVNHDAGQYGAVIVQVFESQALADLLQPSVLTDDAAARGLVDGDKAVAAVIIPAGFSGRIESGNPARGTSGGQAAEVEVYGSATRPISAGVVRGIVDRLLSRMAAGAVAAEVSVTQLIASGIIAPQQAMVQGQDIGTRAAQHATQTELVGLTVRTDTGQTESSSSFDWLGYMAPSMAIMFLMFTVTNGGRSILAEREWGTLPRMLTTPTLPAHILGGKVAGIFFVGLAQMGILITASALIFGVRWGSWLGVVLLTLALVAAATSWGVLLAAYCRTAAQASQLGTMVTLLFGGLAGNFIPRQALPQGLRTASLFTPNALGLEGFISLGAGGTVSDLIPPIVGLLAMAVLLFAASTLAFRRQYA